jgi:hypothetical protein
MNRHRYLLFFILVVTLTSLACNAFAGNEEPAALLPTPVIVDGTVISNAGPPTIAGLAATATLPGDANPQTTAVPNLGPFVTVLVDLNIRTGPGVQYDRLGFLLQNETAPILGVDPASGWWKVVCPANVVNAGECWISGGSQYSRATNANEVPVAVAPPTPTPIPTNTPPPENPTPAPTATTSATNPGTAVEPVNGMVAYTDINGLWILPLDMDSSPPQRQTPRQLVGAPNLSQPLIAPNGSVIAYIATTANGNALEVIATDGSNRHTLATTDSLRSSANVPLVVSQFAWLPNSSGLAFTTYNQPTTAFVEMNADFWTVPLNGAPSRRLDNGQGGHQFAISPNGSTVIFSLPTAVTRANLDGSNGQTLLEFDLVNTASEYYYVPTVAWTNDGSAAFTAVSSPDPWSISSSALPSANLYRLPANGGADLIGQLTGSILYHPVQWNGSGSRLAYVQELPSSSSDNMLMHGQGNGGNLEPYVSGNLTLHGWNPAGSSFAYAGPGYFAIGRPGSAPLEITVLTEARQLDWLTNEDLIIGLQGSGSWSLVSTNVDGDTAVLGEITGTAVQFDLWRR